MSKHMHQEVIIKATSKALYEALIETNQHAKFTGSPAEISREAGGAITCHGGRIVGRNIELVPNQRNLKPRIYK